MKVLMLGPDLQAKGGIAAVVNQYIDAGLNKKIELKYISTMTDTNNCMKLLYTLKALIHYVAVCSFYDIVHVHMASRGSYKRKAIFIFIAKIFGKKIVIHLHGGEFDTFFLNECTDNKKNRIRRTFSIANKIITLSDEWKQKLISILQNDITEKIVVLNNAVKIPNFVKNDYGDYNLVFLGRLVEGKGIEDILQVIPEISNKVKNLKLIICGEGKVKKYKEQCKQLGINDKVVFTGWITGEKKQKILKESSIFVLPSYNEGLPISMLEAMAYGMAVIVSNVGGIPSVVKDRNNGIIINPGNTAELLEAIYSLIGNINYKEQIGKRAYDTVLNNFSIDKNIIKLINIYKDMI